ncbi:hypothetical protein [Cystobacter fuscus]|uniref:hypothetical protein n=1 Tax=Cystobacter fuscus TaxID=43 RepID=UPI0012DC237E|nr:hypothetical protein [Cystobacter fuscus]
MKKKVPGMLLTSVAAGASSWIHRKLRWKDTSPLEATSCTTLAGSLNAVSATCPQVSP